MAYLRNNTVNLLNLHYGIFQLAASGGMGFFVVFLLKEGVSPPLVLCALAFVLAGRFVFRPIILPLGIRFGLRPLVVAGTLLLATPYPFLAEVHGVDWMLLGFCAATIVGDSFYWTAYHAYFASQGDAGHRGRQIGAREALVAVGGIAGPLLGGWAITHLGSRIAFGAAGIVQILAALPLAFTPNVKVAAAGLGGFRAAGCSWLLFATDGWISIGYLFVWQMALFLSLGENFTAFGGAMALAALVGAVAGLILGHHIDAGRGGRVMWFAFAGLAGTALFRVFSTGSPTLAVAANASAALVNCLYLPTLMTAIYNESKRSPCALRFHVAAEGAWDAGGAAGCLFAAAPIALGAPLWVGILLSLAGMAVSAALLRRYYRDIAGGQQHVVLGGVAQPLSVVGEPPSAE